MNYLLSHPNQATRRRKEQLFTLGIIDIPKCLRKDFSEKFSNFLFWASANAGELLSCAKVLNRKELQPSGRAQPAGTVCES